MNRRCVALAIAFVALALPSGGGRAQAYPNRPVRIIVPFAAGGAVDAIARLIGNKLSEQFNQPVVVENRAGAGGNLAPDALAKAAPDATPSCSPPTASRSARRSTARCRSTCTRTSCRSRRWWRRSS
jgi:tripartite-type tricarboxylate transporter receptor subunit TctC